MGLQLAKAGEPDAAQYLLAATQLKPTSHVAEGHARAWISLAHVLEATKPDEAIAAYRQAAALQPKDPEPHLAAGVLLEKQGKFADAESEYKQALALGPSSDALTGLANIYMRGHRLPEAEAELRKLVAAHPEQADAHIQLGRVLAADGKYDEAIAELQARRKAGSRGYFAAARSCRSVRDRQEIRSGRGGLSRAAGGAAPTMRRFIRVWARRWSKQKKFAEAQKEFETAVKLKPDFGEAYGDLAFAASENKDYPLTLKALDTRAKYLPEDAGHLFPAGFGL